MVPDAARFGPRDLDYFLTPVIRDQQKMREHHGGAWRFLHCRDEVKRYVVRQLEEVVLPADSEALAIVDELLRAADLTAAARDCLQVQRREIGIHRCLMERVRNWFQASFHVLEGSQPWPGLPALADVIQQEIDTSQRWHQFEGGTGTLDSPRQRLMRAHRDDPVRRLDLRAYPYIEYRGLNHWPGAHLAK
jgi:hypothetical protein